MILLLISRGKSWTYKEGRWWSRRMGLRKCAIHQTRRPLAIPAGPILVMGLEWQVGVAWGLGETATPQDSGCRGCHGTFLQGFRLWETLRQLVFAYRWKKVYFSKMYVKGWNQEKGGKPGQGKNKKKKNYNDKEPSLDQPLSWQWGLWTLPTSRPPVFW